MRRLVLLVLGAMAILLAACGGGSTADTVGSAPTTTATGSGPAGGEPSVPVPGALRFTADRLGGGTIDAASYAGRPVAFWFWAPT